jgi:ElaB/YqjD/DUF883 family membrane-anchored ribosome-binding protein
MNNNPDTAPTAKDLLNELQALVVEAETLMAGSLSEHTTEARDQLRARFRAAQERLGEICDGAKQKVVAGAKYTDATIRENPYQSLAIALGLGVVLGVLIGRRSK